MSNETSWPHLIVRIMLSVDFLLDVDDELRQEAVTHSLRSIAVRLPELSQGQSWHLGPVRYIAKAIPQDLDSLIILHSLGGSRADEETVGELAARLDAAKGEIPGSWAVMALADVLPGEH